MRGMHDTWVHYRAARHEAFVEEALAGLGDVVLLARLRCAADAAKEPLGYFASALVGDYVQRADDEMWFALVTAASRAPNPAAACLQRMLLQALPENEHLGGARRRHQR